MDIEGNKAYFAPGDKIIGKESLSAPLKESCTRLDEKPSGATLCENPTHEECLTVPKRHWHYTCGCGRQAIYAIDTSLKPKNRRLRMSNHAPTKY